MCPSNCKIRYTADTPLDQITCTCGFGYWNVLQAQFISGTDVREGKAEARETYEQRLKEQIPDPQEREAKLRAQLESHLRGCAAQQAIDRVSVNQASALHEIVAEPQETSRIESLPIHMPETAESNISEEFVRDRYQSRSAGRSTEILEDDEDDHLSGSLTHPKLSLGAGASRQATSELQQSSYTVEPSQYTSSDSPRAVSSSTRTPAQTEEASAPAGDQSPLMSPLMTKFVQFGEGQWTSIATFCKNNSKILEEDFESLGDVVRQKLGRDELSFARQTAHRLILLRNCAHLQLDKKLSYLEGLPNAVNERNRIKADVNAYINQHQTTASQQPLRG
ncbi:hypothetical protein H2198_009469 [Neophaeococcomyces mojaviensis]|uniref:Uncharacterized protein n=1 Tax=Neophaeococcomyces mojaviensis TaxID=3383035 RepID=A0ACC2ZUE2_9EURO|nr:hypothetical protein H2198_009469 [Knufia sp. JES_112]